MGSKTIVDSKRGTNPKNLTNQQRLFVEYLCADGNFNTTEAARQAGYKQPSSKAGQLLRQPKIARYLGKKIRERSETLQIKSEEVLKELLPLAMFDPADLFDEDGALYENIHEIPEGARKMIGGIKQRMIYDKQGNLVGVETEFKLNSKLQSLELLMKHLGMLSGLKKENDEALENWDYSMYEEDDKQIDLVEEVIASVGITDKRKQTITVTKGKKS